jgi:hypothetical protein
LIGRNTKTTDAKVTKRGSLSVGIATVTALLYIIVRPPSWVPLLAIASGAMLLAGCVLVFPYLLAPSPTLEDLAGVEEPTAKDRIHLSFLRAGYRRVGFRSAHDESPASCR